MIWIIFSLLWLLLLLVSKRSKSHFLFFFVLCQFVFIGVGLFIFPYFGFDYLESVFPSFDLSSIGQHDFVFANILIIGSTTSTVLVNKILLYGTLKKKPSNKSRFSAPCIKKWSIVILSITIIFVSAFFTIDNFAGFNYLIFASDISDLGTFVDFRRSATSNYLNTIFVYNILPAASILILLFFLEEKTKIRFCLFIICFSFTSLSLLLTYQKRPILIFWILSGLTAFLYNELLSRKNYFHLKFYDFFKNQKLILSLSILVIFFLYFIYTGLRFQDDFFNTFLRLSEIIFTRLIGRLSLPAVMYIDFFPIHHDFYGLTNVGLVAKITGNTSFLDTKIIFDHYAKSQLDGSVAASVFIDAYGQGGLYISVFYGLFIGLFIWTMDFLAYRIRGLSKKVFFIITGFLFLYYLSQSSLFRASFGYGGVFYFLVWISCFKFKIGHLLSASLPCKHQPRGSI